MSLYLKVTFSIIVCLGLGFLSGISTVDSINGWYTTLNKPFFQPPNWIFGPMWSVLYAMMGIAFALIWNKTTDLNKKKPYLLFASQFILNLLWSPIFFGFQRPDIALVLIVVLLILIALTIKAFKSINIIASRLLWPYFLWVSFATLLNLSIVLLN